MSQIPRARDGQATLEWLALVTLVAGLVVLGAAASQSLYVGRTITRQMARALCVVRSGDCRRDREPCVVHSKEGSASLDFRFSIMHLGGGKDIVVEQRSDGTVAVTKIDRRRAGIEPSAGMRADIHVKGLDAHLGAEAAATLIAHRDRGSTWFAPSLDVALAIVRGDDDRPPDVAIEDDALEGSISGRAGVDAVLHLDVAQGSLSFNNDAVVRRDRQTGARTVSVGAARESSASAAGVLGVAGGAATGTYTVEFDAAGRPVDLQVLAVGSYAGSQDLPGVAQPVAGMLRDGDPGGRIYQVVSHLDLTEPGNLVAARAVLDAIARRRPSALGAQQALRRRIDEQGTVEARVLGVAERRKGDGGQAMVGGLGVGADVRSMERILQLRAAMSRGLDGQWVPRDDCVARPALAA